MACTTLQNRTIYRSDTDEFTVTFTDGDGVAINLSSSEVLMTVRKKYPKTDVIDDTDADISATATIPVGTDGKAYFNITPTQTDIDPREYYYDIQLKNSEDEVRTIGVAKYIVKYDITRRT